MRQPKKPSGAWEFSVAPLRFPLAATKFSPRAKCRGCCIAQSDVAQRPKISYEVIRKEARDRVSAPIRRTG
jgi:hypothetical protein